MPCVVVHCSNLFIGPRLQTAGPIESLSCDFFEIWYDRVATLALEALEALEKPWKFVSPGKSPGKSLEFFISPGKALESPGI